MKSDALNKATQKSPPREGFIMSSNIALTKHMYSFIQAGSLVFKDQVRLLLTHLREKYSRIIDTFVRLLKAIQFFSVSKNGTMEKIEMQFLYYQRDREVISNRKSLESKLLILKEIKAVP